ncbi:hypothetical protein ODJ79_11140 [Actinoplanes sp. KI2]|uniref:hypothetical protein n=1 Tax=Actinoplanes sp. KI2 TaxID=2983315 RepID=UPI0021D57695|nr:hypothetical protein [Actinoplanes sp. KI2]MCU7724270.1 hypothetical protein [Actinoplanes sp. KI2]
MPEPVSMLAAGMRTSTVEAWIRLGDRIVPRNSVHQRVDAEGGPGPVALPGLSPRPGPRMTSNLNTAPPGQEIVVDLGRLRPQLVRGVRVFVETIAVPTLLLYVLLQTAGLAWALSAVIGWCALVLALRRVLGHPLPSTLLLSAGMLCGRAALALVLSSALVYVLQPVVGSALLGVLFLASAAIGRPVTVRLARDFVSLPAHLFQHDGIRRLFTRVTVAWGVSRLLDAAMSLGLLHWGVGFGLVSRPFFSGLLSALTIGLCAIWALRALRRMGVTLRLRSSEKEAQERYAGTPSNSSTVTKR